MTNDYLREYQDYYRLRMQRFEGNPDYARSYAAEKAVFEAIDSCHTLEEFKDKSGDLNERCAVALVLDQYSIRLKHYEGMKETVRAAGCKRILEKAGQFTAVTDLITMVNEEENRTNLELTADTIHPFPDSGWLERREIWSEAEVPEKYKARYMQYAADEEKNLRHAYAEQEKQIRNWQPGWAFDFNRITEERHRRLLPLPEEELQQQIQLTQQLLHAR